MNIDAKILSKILVNCIQQNIKKIVLHDQVCLILEMQGYFNIFKSIKLIHHLVTSINEKKDSGKIQYQCTIKKKRMKKLGIEGT